MFRLHALLDCKLFSFLKLLFPVVLCASVLLTRADAAVNSNGVRTTQTQPWSSVKGASYTTEAVTLADGVVQDIVLPAWPTSTPPMPKGSSALPNKNPTSSADKSIKTGAASVSHPANARLLVPSFLGQAEASVARAVDASQSTSISRTSRSTSQATVTAVPALSSSTASNSQWTSNTVTTISPKGGKPTVVPVLVGCSSCQCSQCGGEHQGLILFGLPNVDEPTHFELPKLPKVLIRKGWRTSRNKFQQ